MCVCLAVSVAMAGHSDDGKRQCPYCHKSFSAVVFKNHKVSICRSWVDRHTYIYVMLLYSRGLNGWVYCSRHTQCVAAMYKDCS